VPALRAQPHTHHRRHALGQLFSVHRPIGFREHGQDEQAEQLVGGEMQNA